MKTKLLRILGVVLTLSMALSLFGVAPVSAGTQSFTSIKTPGNTGQLLPSAAFIGPMEKASDGTLYAAVGATSPSAAVKLYKSTDSGRTWAATGTQPAIGVANIVPTGTFAAVPLITDIECSSANPNIVYVTDGKNIFKSVNGGATWAQLITLFGATSLTTPATGNIVSISVGYFGGFTYVFAATSTFGGGTGGVYVFQESALTGGWTDLEVGTARTTAMTSQDVLQVKVSPDFATTQGIIAVVSDYGAGRTIVTSRFEGNVLWAGTYGDILVQYFNGTAYAPITDTLLSATLWLPDGFGAGNLQMLVGINPMLAASVQGDVFLAAFGTVGTTTSAYDMNIGGGNTATSVSDLDGVGDIATFKVVAVGHTSTAPTVPQAWNTSDGGINWFGSAKRPTGGESPLFAGVALATVRVGANFATNGQALVGTQGTDCGLSVSQLPSDVCATGFTWNTIYFIATTIDAKEDLSLASDNTIYMTTISTGVGYSAWRYMDTTGDGTPEWERINSWSLYPAPAPAFNFIRTLPNQTALFIVDGTTRAVLQSTNKGNLWSPIPHTIPAGGNIYSVLALGPTTLMIGTDGGAVWYTNNLSIWQSRQAAGAGKVTDLRLASNNDIIAAIADTTVRVSRSVFSATNAQYQTWSTAANTSVACTNWAFVAPADGYATSNVVYVSSDTAGVYYRSISGSGSWSRLDNTWFQSSGAAGSISPNRYLTNLQTAPGKAGFSQEGSGMGYMTISDGEVSLGILRLKGTHSATKAGEKIGNPSGATLTGLWVGSASVGSVVLYAFGSDCNIYTYTDTLNQPITGLAVPAASVEIEECPTCPVTFSASASWTALANVSHYFFIVDTVQWTNFYDAVAGASTAVVANYTTATSLKITGLPSQTKFYVSVWGFKHSGTLSSIGAIATTFDISSFGQGTDFTTPAAPAVILAPAAGAGAVPVRPTFQWQAVPGATSYTLTVDDNVDFSSPVKTVTTTATAYAWAASDPALSYSTTYYWRVVATTPAGNSVSTVYAFTTEAKPVEFPTISIPPQITPTVSVTVNVPQPTVNVPLPTFTVVVPTLNIPQPTVIIPQPTVIVPQPTVIIPTPEPEPTPVYIWVIVGIGAILTIAVIVLIVRTRRVV